MLETVERWQRRYLDGLGRRLVYAADELYLLADRPFPDARRVRRRRAARERDRHGGHVRPRGRDGAAAVSQCRARARVAGSSRRSTVLPRPATGRSAVVAADADRAGRPADRDPHRRVRATRPRAVRRSPPRGRGRPRAHRPGREPLLRRQHRGHGAADRNRRRAGARRRAGRPPLPAPRRRPLRGPLPRRLHAWPTSRGRSRSCRPTAHRSSLHSDEHVRTTGRRHRRSPERRQVDARQPDRRPTRRDRRGEARASRATARSSRRAGAAASFVIVDTGGWLPASAASDDPAVLVRQVSEQAERAISLADVVLLRRRRDRRRRRGGRRGRAGAATCREAGARRGEQGRRRATRSRRLAVRAARARRPVPDLGHARPRHRRPPRRGRRRAATGGRGRRSSPIRSTTRSRSRSSVDPNVGKSTLFNRLVGDERARRARRARHDPRRDRHDRRDAGRSVALRRHRGHAAPHAASTRPTEYYGLVRALDAVDRADAALFVIDATAGVTHQDQRLAERIDAAGTAIVVVLNKWDLVDDADVRKQVLDDVARPPRRSSATRRC